MIEIIAGKDRLALPDGQKIRLEEGNDVMDFQVSEPMVSWPFDLPYEANKKAFHFPLALDNPQKPFSEQEAEIRVHHNLWKKGLLSVSKVSQKGIKATFQSKSGILKKYKDTPISKMVNHHFFLSYNNQPDVHTALKRVQADKYSPVQFPLINFHPSEWFANFPFLENRELAGTPKFFLIPAFTIMGVMGWIGDFLGYEVHDHISSDDNDFGSTLIFDNKMLDPNKASFDVQDYLPEMTFLDFINSIRTLFCAQIEVNNERRMITLVSMKKVINSPHHIDLTDQLDGEISVEKVDKAYALGFADSDNEELPSYTPEEGIYEGGATSLKSKFIPVEKSRYTYHDDSILPRGTQGKVKFTRSSNGKLVTEAEHVFRSEIWRFPYFRNLWKIEIEGIKPESFYRSIGKIHDINSLSASGQNMRNIELNTPWNSDAEVSSLKFRRKWSFFFPVVHGLPRGRIYDSSQRRYIEGLGDKSTGARVMIYHGLINYTGPWPAPGNDPTNRSYAFGSSDTYVGNGLRPDKNTLSFVGEHSLVDTYWHDFLRFAATTRLLKGRFKLSLNDLLDFKIFRKVRIRGVDILMRKLKTVVDKNGLKKQEWEGYRLR